MWLKGSFQCGSSETLRTTHRDATPCTCDICLFFIAQVFQNQSSSKSVTGISYSWFACIDACKYLEFPVFKKSSASLLQPPLMWDPIIPLTGYHMVPWEAWREIKYIGLSSQLSWNPWIPSLASIWHLGGDISLGAAERHRHTKITMLIMQGLETHLQQTKALDQCWPKGESKALGPLLLTPLQAPQWMAIPTAPITRLIAPQTRRYWESPGDFRVPHNTMSWEELRPMRPYPLETTICSSSQTFSNT